jgi:hypothetical protein
MARGTKPVAASDAPGMAHAYYFREIAEMNIWTMSFYILVIMFTSINLPLSCGRRGMRNF